MTAELKSLSASLTAPKLPDNLFTVTDIDAELSKVRDDESDFIAADFSRLICAETDFSAICFRNCLFHGCRFTACNFTGCTFIDCVFKGCDISNSDFSESYFKACSFISCKAVGTAFKYSFYKNVSFDGGSFELSDFQRSKLQTVAVTDTDFSSALFSSCEIKQTELKNVTLARSVFFDTKLAGLDFTSCNIEGLTVSDTGAELKGAKVDVWQAAMFAKLLGLIIE